MNKPSDKQIFITRPSLPPLDEFLPYLEVLWEERWLTNNGRFHRQLEDELADFLGVKYVSLFTNATIALVVALKALELEGEVVTTPFSFVATSHAIRWNGLEPVFCDVEPEFLNLDSAQIESVLTERTTAIMPVHVYGNPCDVEAIDTFAKKHGLKVIYDAAHAFGVTQNGKSILNHGDLSVLSFHATKVFNTMEGGAIISHDADMKQHIDYLKNFGYDTEVSVVATGINGKMNEMQAALGLTQLKHFNLDRKQRAKIDEHYRLLLNGVKGIHPLSIADGVKANFSYFPVFIDKAEFGASREKLYEHLKTNNVRSRRYFYPLITDFPDYRELPSADHAHLPIAAAAAETVLCLPIYPGLDFKTVEWIVELIRQCPSVNANQH